MLIFAFLPHFYPETEILVLECCLKLYIGAFSLGLGCLSVFPGGSDSKESTCNVGDLDSVPGLRRSPGGGHGNPPQYSCLENPQGQRSLVGYSPWGLKESDTTE